MIGFTRLEAPAKEFTLKFDLHWNEEGRLTGTSLADESVHPIHAQPPYGVAALMRELRHFFSTGEPLLPLHWSLLDVSEISEFAMKVYEATLAIPHGETRTYSWVAFKIGKPLASRAVGQALKRNPFPILVPCHRVVSDKTLGGFMGKDDPADAELVLKAWLLDIERMYRNPYFSFLSVVK